MRKLLLGTDFRSDCDDAIALRMLARAVKNGEIELLGVAINTCTEYALASVKGFLSAEGVEGIPIGIDLSATELGTSARYQKRLAEHFCPDGSNADGEDALRLYRRILATVTEKIEIVEIGFLQVVAALLKSEGDDISEKSGMELVREKVSKFWVMAGKWDADGEKEYNFAFNAQTRLAGKEFCELCPVPVTFLGWEVGTRVISGSHLEHDDFLYRVLADHGSENGRDSWDPMLVLLALTGDEDKAGYETVTGVASVDAESGANHFGQNEGGTHKFVIKKYADDYYVSQIDRRIESVC